MFWTIFFAVLAAMCVPVVLPWLVIGAVKLAAFHARFRAEHWVGFCTVALGVVACTLALLAGRH